MMNARPMLIRSTLRAIRPLSRPAPAIFLSLTRTSKSLPPLRRHASTTALPSQPGHPPPAPSTSSASQAPTTPALEPQSTSAPSVPAESAPSGTIPPSPPPTDPSQPTTTTITRKAPEPLTWNAYLSLRRKRRHYNLFASILCAASTTFIGAGVILDTLNRVPLESLSFFGLDPFFVSGIAMLACGATGWMVGPVLGGMVFRGWYRRVGGEVASKEKDFYTRIRKHRVDPSNSGASRLVPDYYGEKIGSVAQYRTWLRDQRAYNKKREA